MTYFGFCRSRISQYLENAGEEIFVTLLAADEGNWCRGGSFTTSPAPSTAVSTTPQIRMRDQLATLAVAVVLDFEELWTR